jgi:Zn-dependent protease
VIYDITGRRARAVRPSPVFLAFVAAAVGSAVVCWNADAVGSAAADFAVFAFVVCGWVVSLSVHEFGHAYAAYRGGDREVEARGYLTLNPFKYAHPVLSVVLPVLFIVQGGIGLPGGAVYLHPHSLRSKRAQSLAAAAGPASNAVFAAASLIAVHSHLSDVAQLFSSGSAYTPHTRFWAALAFFGFLQVTATVLNLLPIPGLDGWSIIEPFVDAETARAAEKIKPWGMLGVFVLLFYVQSINQKFFDVVYRIYDWCGGSRTAAAIGHVFFKFWVRNPP